MALHGSSYRWWCVALCLLASIAASSCQQQSLQDFIDAAIQSKATSVVIPPGDYAVQADPSKEAHVVVRDAHDLEIVADGVNLICLNQTRAIHFEQCSNVVVKGITVDYAPTAMPFTQGTVVVVSQDRSYVDVKLHDGYRKTADFKRIVIVNPRTLQTQYGSPYTWDSWMEALGNGNIRVHMDNIGLTAVVGSYVAFISYDGSSFGLPHAVSVFQCAGRMVFEDVTIYTAPGAAFVETAGPGGTIIRRMKIVPGPMLPGAKVPRLLSAIWDGLLHIYTHVGPTVEDSVIERCGDDTWSIASLDLVVLAITEQSADRSGSGGASLVVASRDDTVNLTVGDTLTLGLGQPAAQILAIDTVPLDEAGVSDTVLERLANSQQYDFWDLYTDHGVFVMEVTGSAGFQVGSSVHCPDRQGNGFVFRNNLVDSVGRVIAKGGGRIENNIIKVGDIIGASDNIPEGAFGGYQLSIVNNTLIQSRCVYPAPYSIQAGAISVTGVVRDVGKDTSVAWEAVEIADNTISDACGVNIVLIAANEVSIHDNNFVRAQFAVPDTSGVDFSISQTSVVYIAQSANVTLNNNIVVDALGPYGTALVDVGSDADVTNVRNGVRIGPLELSAPATSPAPAAASPDVVERTQHKNTALTSSDFMQAPVLLWCLSLLAGLAL